MASLKGQDWMALHSVGPHQSSDVPSFDLGPLQTRVKHTSHHPCLKTIHCFDLKPFGHVLYPGINLASECLLLALKTIALLYQKAGKHSHTYENTPFILFFIINYK